MDSSNPVVVGVDSPQSRCEFYRRVCDLPAVVDVGTGQITFRAGALGAVIMPVALGQQVRAAVDRKAQGPYPIIGQPRAGAWTFLVRSDLREAPAPAVRAQLWRARVAVITEGDIGLPSPASETRPVRIWVAPATTPFRLSGTDVLAVTRAAITATEARSVLS
ncbi:DNA-directed RNA polymerase subunit beta [Nocardia thailandica]|uniref:DNA-directed RNA polymerase subunit beta n=1 Tax=Nocardia thailandica TaxID=257275 RepID=A0ABW6PUB6_9NOCA